MTERCLKRRTAGVLLPVFSLPSRGGIGTLGAEAYRFIDFLVRAGQSVWQMLPLTPTGYGDSPYQSVSGFAGNPYLIDLGDACRVLGIEGHVDLSSLDAGDAGNVDYGLQYTERYGILRKMYELTRDRLRAEAPFNRFIREESAWLCPYARFMALSRRYDGAPFQTWQEPFASHTETDADLTSDDKAEEGFHYFLQYIFSYQFRALRAYAIKKHIRLIGDMPLYVSLDSADVWSNRTQFLLNDAGYPTEVAGVPPDLFSSDGQLWGNPLYRWDAMRADGFRFWRARMAHAMALFDAVRIDHFIGTVNYYAIPAGDTTAKNGVWRQAPGEELLSALIADGASLIAEDLGNLTDEVIRVRDKFGLPGMNILEFAFDSDAQNRFLPFHYIPNSIVYGGTHDNETLVGYFAHSSPKVRENVRKYLHVNAENPAEAASAVIHAGYASVSDYAIMSMQDLMGLGNEARCNTPATSGGNWQYRLPHDYEARVSAEALRLLAEQYDRGRTLLEKSE